MNAFQFPNSNRHYLCISAPAMPLPPLEPMPGPGHYNIVDYEGPPKHYMSGSVFVSTTSRWTGGAPGEDELPGPGIITVIIIYIIIAIVTSHPLVTLQY